MYMAICLHADETGGCFPSYNTIAEEVDYNLRTCKRAVEELVELGLVEKEHRLRKDGSLSSNYYQIIDKGVVTHTTPPSGLGVTTLTKTIKELDKSNSSPKKSWFFNTSYSVIAKLLG